MRPRRSSNHRSGPLALTRVPLAFDLCYHRSSPLLVPIDSFGVDPDAPGAKRSHLVTASERTYRPPYSRIVAYSPTRVPREIFSQLHTLNRAQSHCVPLVYLTSKTVYRKYFWVVRALTRPLSHSVYRSTTSHPDGDIFTCA